MTFHNNRKLMAGVLSVALLLPAATAFGNDWSKPKSRLKGTAIGTAAGAVVGGPVGAVVVGAVGNGVQYLRRQSTAHRYRHHRRY
jgi:MFS family permease